MTNLFYSETAQNILGILCQRPNGKYHINDLIRKTGKYPYSVQTALKKLEKLNLVTSSKYLNKKFYQMNKENPIFPEIRNIFSKLSFLVDTKLAPLVEEVKWVKTVNRLAQLPYSFSLVRGLDEPMKSLFGFPFKYYWFNGVTGGCYYNKAELERASEKINQIVKDPSKTSKLLETFEAWINQLIKKAQALRERNLARVRKKELANYISDFNKAYANIAALYITPRAMEMALFSDIKSSLKLILSVKRKTRRLNHYLDLLTAADPEIEERIKALKIATHIKKNGFDQRARKLLSSHTQKFSFLAMYFLTDYPMTVNDFIEEINTLIKKYHSPEKELARIKKEREERRRKIKAFFDEFRPSNLFREKIRLFKKVNNLRTKRVYATSKTNFYFKPIYLEVVKRMKIPPKYHFNLTLDELEQYFKTGAKPALSTLQKRNVGWAILVWKGRMRIITGFKGIIETMERLKIVPEIPRGIYAPPLPKPKIKYPLRGVKSLKGMSVFRGVVKGKAKLVESQADLKKIRMGDILVSDYATPAYLSALYKAAGMVVNEGTLTSHAALYAKALKIPTIIGTEAATEVFKDGDNIEVDAVKGIVKKIEN